MNSRLLNKLTWLPILSDLRELAKEGLSPNQKTILERMLRNFVLIIFGGGSAIGAMILFLVLNISSGVGNTNLVPTTDTGDNIIVPASPGNTAALTVCKKGIVEKGQTHIDGGSKSMVDGYNATFGQDRLSYVDNPPGGQNRVVILNGSPVTVGEEVTKCLISRAK